MATANEIRGLEILHGASSYLAANFSIHMTRKEAQASLQARAILFNCSNAIFKQHGCGISQEEVEGSLILERNSQAGGAE